MLIKLLYFNNEGKWKYDGNYESRYNDWQVFDEVKQMRLEKKLPGLASGNWDGSIVILGTDSCGNCIVWPMAILN